MSEENDSVQDWIDRAKRAHDLVERVDLGRVEAHDAKEVNKLDKITAALHSLSQGTNVEYVPGVDEDEAPTLDENHIRRSVWSCLTKPAWVSAWGGST